MQTNVMTRSKLGALLCVIVFVVALSQLAFQQVKASPNDIIINEIMYNPLSDNPSDEYLEIYNTTGSVVDLEGWCFTEGITMCFGPGSAIGANGYELVSPNPSQTTTTYGKTPIGVYTGSLSNGGETLTLVDDTTAVVNTITYDDAAPWPTSPDGSGPSLELKDPGLDNTQAINWAASVGGPTPGVANSVSTVVLPTITDVFDPNDIDAGQTVTINATVTDADTVNLVYKVNFDSEQTVPMATEGADVYSADIPSQSVGDLVRFKIVAENNDGEKSSPSNDESINYHGYQVRDPSVTSNIPILNWFISDADYQDMQENHVFDNVYLPCVVVYGNEVYDNAEIRIKGEQSRHFSKKSYKVKLPSGYGIDMAGGSNRQINEFVMNSDFKSSSGGATQAVWWMLDQSGLPTPDILPMRVQKNGEFEGFYYFGEKYEKEWRAATGRDNGELYEDFYEAVDGANDITHLESWRDDMMLDRADPQRRANVLDQVDLPNIFNYMGAQVMMSSWDHFVDTNQFQYYDAEHTGRWSIFYWDVDSMFVFGPDRYLSPYDTGDPREEDSRFTTTPVYDQPDLRSMFLRRLRTLADKFYTGDQLKTKMQEYIDLYEDEMVLDRDKWPGSNAPDDGRAQPGQELSVINQIKGNLFAYFNQPWGLPDTQKTSDEAQVFIEQAEADLDNGDEFIRVSSTATTPVDISGWVIEGLGYTIPQGAVVPAGGSIYFLRDDPAYRALHDPVIAGGQFNTDMNDLGDNTLILKTATGTEIDSYDF